MLRSFLLFLALAALPFAAVAQPTEAVPLLDAGHERFAAGDYQGAVEAYQQALATGYASAPLYYHLGNAYYRLDQLGQAVRYYERARRLRPDAPEIRHNLAMVRAQMLDQFTEAPKPFWLRWWEALVERVGAGPLFVGGLLLYLVAMALLGYRLWTRSRSDWLRRGLAVSLLVGGLLVVMGFAASYYDAHDRTAVVLADAVPLYNTPASDAESTRLLHQGTKLAILQARFDWLEVRLPNGVTGWIEAEAVGEV